ncbi:hypothetical protein [Planococcus citreus]|uniref:Uncharacterized protein n=1 Tax=Planococcus citreus TaxID=1373 RepID=A0A497YPA2_9BACL|nr:hypothetical protein [Planococcus citreus]RLJ90163.1 hypothetical protein DFR62_0305 [Planococcus citreus]
MTKKTVYSQLVELIEVKIEDFSKRDTSPEELVALTELVKVSLEIRNHM